MSKRNDEVFGIDGRAMSVEPAGDLQNVYKLLRDKFLFQLSEGRWLVAARTDLRDACWVKSEYAEMVIRRRHVVPGTYNNDWRVDGFLGYFEITKSGVEAADKMIKLARAAPKAAAEKRTSRHDIRGGTCKWCKGRGWVGIPLINKEVCRMCGGSGTNRY